MQWSIESIAAVAAASGEMPATAAVAQSTAAPEKFASLMQREIGELNASVGAAESAMQDLAAGRSVQLHEVMISLEHARLSVQTFVHVRNKLIESYQDLMRMQL